MMQTDVYIQLSLTYNLFWARIMKEHAIFIQGSLPPPAKQLADQAAQFMQEYDKLLAHTIRLSNGSISRQALQSGQYYTRYTEEAERIARKDTGIPIELTLTQKTYNIEPLSTRQAGNAGKEQEVSSLNQSLLNLTNSYVRFKSQLLKSQSACSLFSFLFTADLDHILQEAIRYAALLSKLQQRDSQLLGDYRAFWTQNMAQHAKSMHGLFNPTETKYIAAAHEFAQMFDALSPSDTNAVLADTEGIANFKAAATQGLIDCSIQAIMLPLYTDHLLREANHFLFLLQT